MNEGICTAIILAALMLCVSAFVLFNAWARHAELMAKIQAGQKVEQTK